jgi:hypothetical protein
MCGTEGSKVPDYQGKIATHRDATSYYKVTGKLKVEKEGYFYAYLLRSREPLPPGGETYFSKSEVNILPSTAGYDGSSSKGYELCLGKFLSNAGEAIAPFKGPTFLGELKDTLNMLRNPASGLRDGFSAYLQRARSIAQGVTPGSPAAVIALKAISDLWLEYVYGWKPLFNDLKSASDALSLWANKVQYVKVEASEMRRENPSYGYANTSTWDIAFRDDRIFYLVNTKQWRDTTWRIKGEVRLPIQGPAASSFDTFRRYTAFEWQEFIPTLWELCPYSFVVDYFTNIGDILNSTWALTSEWSWLSASRQSKYFQESSQKLDQRSMKGRAGNFSWTEKSVNGKVSICDYERWRPTLRLPSLVFQMPNEWQWLNLSALITSLSTRRFE